MRGQSKKLEGANGQTYQTEENIMYDLFISVPNDRASSDVWLKILRLIMEGALRAS